MTRNLITFTIAGAAALSINAAAQTAATRPGQGGTATPPQEQSRTPSPQPGVTSQIPRPGDSVTFTGCVRQASDQATLFALYSMPGSLSLTAPVAPGSTTGTAPSAPAPPRTNPTDRSTGADQSPAAGVPSPSGIADADHSRTQAPDARTNQAPVPANPHAGSWYRLTPASNVQDLKEYVGKTVRVTGVYTPATRSSTGTENQSMTQFTAGDVSTSPVIAIASVTPVAMTCSGATSN